MAPAVKTMKPLCRSVYVCDTSILLILKIGMWLTYLEREAIV